MPLLSLALDLVSRKPSRLYTSTIRGLSTIPVSRTDPVPSCSHGLRVVVRLSELRDLTPSQSSLLMSPRSHRPGYVLAVIIIDNYARVLRRVGACRGTRRAGSMASSVSVLAPSCGLATRPVRPTASAYFK